MDQASETKTCFVVMPFGEKIDPEGKAIPFDTVYHYIIKEVVENRLGCVCIRSDKITTAGWVHKDMLEHIVRDDIVIVDITTLNPNVFYELGVRHALKPSITILIRMKGTKLPFNIRGMRIIEYELDIASASKAKDEIEKFIRNGLKKQKNDSLVYEVLPNLKVSLN